ncbi:MAG: hypothetical protein ABFC67_15235 [Mizugakiibacter sp.]|uniref:hypothetical protein n=1 Tax=Mizugakiibacter sp. TaxID=1972610 RepID=UPI0031C00156|nr:hypothetical protein [Xanthomonadaceae bacterium]
MPSDEDLISEREFDEVWGAYLKASGDLFAFEDVRDQSPNYVWTILETGGGRDGRWYAQPGFHIVNKLGYVMTRKPWPDPTPDAIYLFFTSSTSQTKPRNFNYRCRRNTLRSPP